MATFPGWQVEGSLSGHKNPHVTGDIGEGAADEIWPPSVTEVEPRYPLGLVLDSLPIDQPAAGPENGDPVYSFLQDYYFRVHIVPDAVHFGALIAFAERQVEVWSAHFVGNLLSSIDAVGDEGLTLVEPTPAPTTFEPLESRFYTVQADATGPAVLDATYTFNFALDTSVLVVTGDRIVPFPFSPDWSLPVTERLEWRTTVLSSYSAKEQRQAVRNGARFLFEYTLRQGGDRDRVYLENLLHGWHSRVFAVPLWHQQDRLASDLLAGSTTIATNTDDVGYLPDGVVALVDGLQVEIAEIAVIAPGVLTLTRGTNRFFPRGSKVAPARFVRLNLNAGVEYPSDSVVGLPVRFQGVYEEDISPAAESADYRSYPVLLDRRDWAQDRDANYSRFVFQTDFDTGLVQRDDRADVSNVARGHGWVFDGRSAVSGFRAWLAAREGRLRPFWYPSGHADFLVLSAIGSTSTAMTVENRGHARLIGTQTGRRDFMLELFDGTRFYRRITSAQELDEATESIAFDSSLGQLVQPDDVRRVSYLGLNRLTADAVEIAHVTDATSRAQLRLSLIRDDVA